MEFLVLFGVPLVLFAYIGRNSVPASERRPLSSWRASDIVRNVWIGLIVCAVHTPLDRTMEEMFSEYRY